MEAAPLNPSTERPIIVGIIAYGFVSLLCCACIIIYFIDNAMSTAPRLNPRRHPSAVFFVPDGSDRDDRLGEGDEVRGRIAEAAIRRVCIEPERNCDIALLPSAVSVTPDRSLSIRERRDGDKW